MKKKLVSLLLTATMVMGVLSGCGNGKMSVSQTGDTSTDEKVEMTAADDVDGTTITFWHSMGGVNGQAIDTLVNKFNEENEYGITVEAQYQGEYDDSLNKLKSAQIGNMGADLVQVESNLAAYYTIDDKLYSMPFNSSTPIMYYNKDMFAQAGITEVPDSLEGISKIGDQLMNQGGASEVMSLGIYGWFFEQFVGKQGLDYANNGNGRDDVATAVDFDKNGAAKNILIEWQPLNQEGYAPIVGKGGDAGLADFSAGKSAITLGSTASLKQILQDVNGKFEVGTAYFPKIKESDEGGVSIGGASLWALNNQDPKKLRATWEFVKFLISPESQAYWNAQTGYFPGTTAAHEEQTFKDNIAQYPQFQTAIDQLHDSSPEYCGALLSVFPEARATVESEIESMLNGKESVDEAVTNMADTINKSIDDYNTVNN